MSTIARDRLEQLRASVKLNGIDFVEIAAEDQKALRVHFLNAVPLANTLTGAEPVTISGGETIPSVAVTIKPWSLDADGRPLLDLTVSAPGDFSTYTLRIESPALDRFYREVPFSFKALCPSTIDCETPPHVCPPPAGEVPPIDYLAKDFLSFREALSDFSALRYPEWQERNRSDFGVMFMEALCAVADDLSYLQDRIANEATLETATQRRSIVRHARLVDYEPRPALSSRVLLQFEVGSAGEIPSHVRVAARGDDGTQVDFETGTRLDKSATYKVSPAWNRSAKLTPYVWSDGQLCVPAGSTDMWVAGKGHGFQAKQQLLIETRAAGSADPPLREVVTLTDEEVKEDKDLLFGEDVTHLVWRPEDRLRSDHDIGVDGNGVPLTIVVGNLVPATQGRLVVETFAIPGGAPGADRLAVSRTGPRTGGSASRQILYSLAEAPLAWLPENGVARPEILLRPVNESPWAWVPRLVDAGSSDHAFTVEPFRMRAVARNSDGTVTHDYDDDAGETIRFGDGTFGIAPVEGSRFEVTYRVGEGARGNVAPDAITWIAPGAPALIAAVSNPFAAAGGEDEEPGEQVRRLAPHAFRATQFRAVRSEDYARTSETLPWVQKGGSTFRWSGSWMTAFTTVDPSASVEVSVGQRIELIELLNRRRLAGYESYVPLPRYVSLDLSIVVCARSEAFRGDVEEAVRDAVGTGQFFHPDAFTFGTPLERSRLEAVVQAANGVGGVLSIRFRRRGASNDFADLPQSVAVARDEILRVDNDPNRPERGSIRIRVEGGK